MSDSDPFKHAQAAGVELEQLQQIATDAQPTKFGIPTTWREADGPIVRQGPMAQVVGATPQDVRQYIDDAPKATCGSCRYFDLELGRKKIIEERFAEKLVHEHGWKMHHLSVPPDSIGLCGASGGQMATTIISKSCDQYRPFSTRAGRWRM